MPSIETLNKLDKMYEQGENTGKEQLIVGGDNLKTSKIVEGESDSHLSPENFQDARIDLVTKGETPTWDAHLHPNSKDGQGNVDAIGEMKLSPADTDPKNNVGNTRPNILLGYKDGAIPDPTKIGGATPIKPIKMIGFYNTNGFIGPKGGMKYSDFKSTVSKINKTQ